MWTSKALHCLLLVSRKHSKDPTQFKPEDKKTNYTLLISTVYVTRACKIDTEIFPSGPGNRHYLTLDCLDLVSISLSSTASSQRISISYRHNAQTRIPILSPPIATANPECLSRYRSQLLVRTLNAWRASHWMAPRSHSTSQDRPCGRIRIACVQLSNSIQGAARAMCGAFNDNRKSHVVPFADQAYRENWVDIGAALRLVPWRAGKMFKGSTGPQLHSSPLYNHSCDF